MFGLGLTDQQGITRIEVEKFFFMTYVNKYHQYLMW